MNDRRRRLTLVTGATMALLVAGTTVASAHGPSDRDEDARGFGFGGAIRERVMDRMDGGLGMFGARFDSLVATETTLALDEGFVTHRIEKGVVDSASDTSLSVTLANGDASSVNVDADTQALATLEASADTDADAFPFRRRFAYDIADVAVADIAVGSEAVIWSTGQDDGTFLAQRILVLPAADASSDDAATEDGTTTDGTTDGTTEDAEASPAT